MAKQYYSGLSSSNEEFRNKLIEKLASDHTRINDNLNENDLSPIPSNLELLSKIKSIQETLRKQNRFFHDELLRAGISRLDPCN